MVPPPPYPKTREILIYVGHSPFTQVTESNGDASLSSPDSAVGRRPLGDLTNKEQSITPQEKEDARKTIEDYDKTHETPLCEVLPKLKGS